MSKGLGIGLFDGRDGRDSRDGRDGRDGRSTGEYGAGQRSVEIGISPTITPENPTADPEDWWWPGNAWPATNPIATDASGVPVRLHEIYPMFAAGVFKSWSPENGAIVLLTEFAAQIDPGATGDPTAAKYTKIDVPGPPTAADVRKELIELIGLIEYRASVMEEALQQRGTIIGYFQAVLSFDYLSHPNTVILAHAALAVGQFVAMHYKARFNRPRPSQLASAIAPPIVVPQHASYPSAHATEAYLIAHALAAVMINAGGIKLYEKAHPNVTRNALQDMADRIARNREVLGVHYPSDSAAGKLLAEAAWDILAACPSFSGTDGLIAKAKREWKDIS